MENRIFIDTNIALDELFQDRQNSKFTNALIDKYLDNNAKLVINDLSLNTIYYIGSKIDWQKTFEFLKNVTFENPLWEIHYINQEDLREVYDLMEVHKGTDFEDLQQYISAKNSNCSQIITNDKNFPKFDLPLKRTNTDIEDYLSDSTIKKE